MRSQRSCRSFGRRMGKVGGCYAAAVCDTVSCRSSWGHLGELKEAMPPPDGWLVGAIENHSVGALGALGATRGS